MLQNKPMKTGNGSEKQENLKFPVTFDLKVVIEAIATTEAQQNNIESILSDLQVRHTYKNRKMSTKGTYTSYTYEVLVQSRDQMQLIYTEIKQIQGFKFAL